jgi:hypothetical protein
VNKGVLRMRKTCKNLFLLVLALALLLTCLTGCAGNQNVAYDETAGFTVQVTKWPNISDELWGNFLESISFLTCSEKVITLSL